MIVQRTEQLRELINSYKDAASSATEAQRLTNSLQGIQAAVSGLQRSLPALRALAQFSLITQAPSLGGPRQVVEQARAAADGSARAFAGTEDCGRLLDVLNAVADEARTQVIQAWQDFSTSNQRNLPGDLLSALARVHGYHKMAERAQRAAERLTEVIGASGPLPTALQIEAAVHARDELDSALAEIQNSVPPRVQATLRKCMSPQGLPLDEASEEFRAWMRAHNIEGSFVIRIR